MRVSATIGSGVALTVAVVALGGVLGDKPPMHYAHEDALAFANKAAAIEEVNDTPTVADRVWTPPRPGVITHWGRVEEAVGHAATYLQQSPQLQASPMALVDGEDLVITWSGIDKPHAKDFVGLSCGPQAHPRDFLATVSVNQADATPHSVRFGSLYMMRCNYTATYMHFDKKINDHRSVASLQVAMKDSFVAPKHGHIALTSQLDEMAIMFNSASPEIPMVKYGVDANALDMRATGNWTTYNASDMCEAPATTVSQVWFRDPGYMHKVILQKLTLGKRYFYQFGNDRDGWSAVFSFKSRPDPSVKRAKFIAYADMGVEGAPAATSTAVRSFQDVMQGGFDDFLLHFGDISYALGHGHMWDEFFHIIEPYATRVPYMVSIGNHEYDYLSGGKGKDPSGATEESGRMDFHPSWGNFGGDSAGECSVPMFHRWHAPQNGRGIYWYSFDYGGVHVIQMSSEHDWRRGSPQYKWLENDLKSVDRNNTPWVVLTAHRMMYTTQLGEEKDLKVSLHFREEMEDLLWQYKVNAMLVGHQHSYERSCAVRNGKCTSDGVGPVHIVVGSAGAGLEKEGFSSKIGEWSVSHINDWGYLRIESTESEMQIQFVLNRNGVVYDEVALKPW